MESNASIIKGGVYGYQIVEHGQVVDHHGVDNSSQVTLGLCKCAYQWQLACRAAENAQSFSPR